MKFDTKTASPQSNPNCYLQVNKYIRCEQTPVATAVTPATPNRGDKDKLGRQLFYEPHVFFSPVLASQRVVEERHGPNSLNYNDNQSNKSSTTPPKKRLMTAEGVDALTQQLDALCLGGATAAAPVTATTAPVAAATATATVAATTATATVATTTAAVATAVAATARAVAAIARAVAAIVAAANKKKEQETAPVSPKSVSFETDVGRFEQSFYSPKSHCHVTVKRSCRLAELGTK
jgi:hypothetical protein